MAFLFSTCRTNFDRRTGRNFMIVLVLQHSRSIIISAITSNFAGQNNIDKKKKKKTKNPRSPPPLEEEIRGERGTKREVHRHFRSSIHQFGKTREILYPTPARTSFLFIHPPPTLARWKNRRGRRSSPFLSPKTTNVNRSSRFVASLFYRETRIRLLTASSHFSSREIWRAKLWWDCCGRDEKVDRGAILLSTRHQR